jgi:stearoyl-CoA desaturase (delta-9 desaturase)
MPDAVGTTPFAYKTFTLFCLVVAVTLIGTPLFGYLYGYTLFDWALFAILYVCTGLGITVGYHRLISHRSFECHPWVKALLLIAGGWALQNSALRWSADHLRHHARTDQEEDPYNAQKGFWHSHCIWLFINTSHRTENYERQLRKDPIVMWQHRHYHAVVISGLAFPLLLGYLVFFSRRNVPDVHGAQFDLCHQLLVSYVRNATTRNGGQQPGQLAGLFPQLR